MSKTAENTRKTVNFISEKFENGELNNDSLVQIIERCIYYGNIMSIPEYVKTYKKSYNGVKKHRNIILIANKKFVMDND